MDVQVFIFVSIVALLKSICIKQTQRQYTSAGRYTCIVITSAVEIADTQIIMLIYLIIYLVS